MRHIVPFPFDFMLSFLILPGYTFAIFPMRRDALRRNAGKDPIPYSQHALIFTKSFYRFYHSLCLYPPCPVPTYQSLSAIRRIQNLYPSVGIRNERTREKTNFESGCLKGWKSLGRRRAKGRKNIPESSTESISIHPFQMIFSLSIFYHRQG